jgi:formylglycine-generating enzyme required for sulfatase activity
MAVLNPCSKRILVLLLGLAVSLVDFAYGDQGNCGSGQVYLSGGSFPMGSQNALFKDEYPLHQVTLSAFCLSQYETTVAEFWKWAQAGRISFDYSKAVEEEAQFSPHNPVRNISWYLADRYCRSKGGRLPTEAEWEYAATVDTKNGDDKYPWPSGKEFPMTDEDLFAEVDEFAFLQAGEQAAPSQVSYREEEILYSRIQPVLYSYQGINDLYGMLGNVWEWTADWYGPYTEQPVEDPQMMRGTLRNRANPAAEYYHIGFRCAWPPK